MYFYNAYEMLVRATKKKALLLSLTEGSPAHHEQVHTARFRRYPSAPPATIYALLKPEEPIRF